MARLISLHCHSPTLYRQLFEIRFSPNLAQILQKWLFRVYGVPCYLQLHNLFPWTIISST
jgi:hypothetical protein